MNYVEALDFLDVLIPRNLQGDIRRILEHTSDEADLGLCIFRDRDLQRVLFVRVRVSIIDI